MIRQAMILLTLALVAVQALATDRDGNYVIWGVGRASCNTYLHEHGDDAAMSKFKAFLMGYLTAYNAFTPDTYRISGQRDLNALLEWLDEYCAAHPMDGFEFAVQQLIKSLEPEKLRRAPRPGSGWTR